MQDWGKLFLSWIALLAWMIIIFWVSAIPDLEPGFSDGANIFISKIAHIGEYALLTFLLLRALGQSFSSLTFQSLLEISFLLAYAYAVSDEFHQLFVQGREGTFRDVMIDAVGITVVLLYLSQQKKGR